MSRRSINDLATQFNATAAADANTMIANTDLQAGDPYVKSLKLLRDTIEDLINNDTVSDTAIALNTAKTGISDAQTAAIVTNTRKTGISDAQTAAITANTSKTGISTSQASAITANTAKTGISTAQASAITANTAKTGISSAQAREITANTAKTGISTAQASAITANTAKISTAVDLIPETDLGTLLASVVENRGVYTLRFTFTSEDGRTTKTADITMR